MPEMRLQRFLARAGVASRRSSEAMMLDGRITVNGHVANKLGMKINTEADVVCVDGKRVCAVKDETYIMLNKPLDCLTTMHDPQGRRCVADILPIGEFPGLFPVGRLDRNTTGLLLFTTNGDMGNALLHPSHHVLKVYEVRVSPTPSRHKVHMLRGGVKIESGKGKQVVTHPAEVELLEAGQTALLRIGIREGINRQVRKMCAAIGCEVITLHRRAFGPLTLQDLPLGTHRPLTDSEIDALKAAVK